MADWQMVGKLNGGSMILSSAWTCVIWVSRFGDEGDQRALVQNKWHEQLALVRSSTLGRILSRSREQAASPISPSPVPYWRYGAEHGPSGIYLANGRPIRRPEAFGVHLDDCGGPTTHTRLQTAEWSS
jgi:hypothetical protein